MCLVSFVKQHSIPGFQPYDYAESNPLVDVKRFESVQTSNSVALTSFAGRIWQVLVVFKASNRGKTHEVMIC